MKVIIELLSLNTSGAIHSARDPSSRSSIGLQYCVVSSWSPLSPSPILTAATRSDSVSQVGYPRIINDRMVRATDDCCRRGTDILALCCYQKISHTDDEEAADGSGNYKSDGGLSPRTQGTDR